MRRRAITAALFLLVLLAASIGPQPAAAEADPPPNPVLLKDINPAESEGSSPNHFMPAGPVTYFFAKQTDGQPALFKTDGTSAGTGLVKTGIRPGEDNSSAVYNGYLYFPAGNDENGTELWRTDGTPDRTELFADLDPGYWSSDPTYLTVFEDKLYFAADWHRFRSTDGTTENIFTDFGLQVQSQMVEFNGSLYFSAYRPDYYGDNDQFSLDWFGSGGSGSTTDLIPGYPSVIYKNRLYFTASRADVGLELWSTAGTLESIQLLRDVNPQGNANIGTPFVYNGWLYFTGEDAGFGQRLWRSDGSASGTTPVFDPPDSTSRISLIGAVQPAGAGKPGGLLLSISDPLGNRQLWVSNGTAAGTVFLADQEPFDPDRETSPGVLFNNVFYFSGYDKGHGAELWRTDGTLAGTVRLLDLLPGPRGSLPVGFAPCGPSLCFSADDGQHGQELWSTDGTPTGTTLVADLNTHPAGAYPWGITQAGGLLYFFARDSVSAMNLWRTDGTASGTLALNLDPAVKIQPYPEPAFHRMAALGNSLFFLASDSDHGLELWKSDGSQKGTGLLKDIWPGKYGSNSNTLVAAGNRLFFFATSPQVGDELWVSDGTPGGTKMVKEIVPNDSYHLLSGIVAFGNLVLFCMWHGDTSNFDLWRSDGTAAGTWLIRQGLYINDGIASGGKFYFSYFPGLWETDGTPAGTKEIPLDLSRFGYYSSYTVSHLVAVNQDIYFFVNVYDGWFLYHLSPSQGISEGVHPFYNINGVSAQVLDLVSLNGQAAVSLSMYAPEVDGPALQLWVSDGSETGAHRVEAGFNFPGNLVPLGGSLFFFASDPASGTQIWKTDGTSAGTQRISSYPQSYCTFPFYDFHTLAFRDNLFLLPLDDGSTGCELWVWPFDYLTHKTRLPIIFR